MVASLIWAKRSAQASWRCTDDTSASVISRPWLVQRVGEFSDQRLQSSRRVTGHAVQRIIRDDPEWREVRKVWWRVHLVLWWLGSAIT
jgi:hypothetical protein